MPPPGNGSPKTNKGCEIAKLRKRVEELERENGLLKAHRSRRSRRSSERRELRVP